MRGSLGVWRFIPLLIAGLILTACGGDGDEAADTDTDTLAITTPTPGQVESSPPGEPTDEPDETVTVDAPSPTTGNDEQSADSPANSGEDVPDDPWGKDIPEGPAPTAPPAPPSDFDSDGDGMYTLDEFEEAIRFRYGEYEWPPNYVLDLDKAIEGWAFPADSRIEAPGEYTFLGMYHICAWELTLIDASLQGDQELIDESLYQLVDFGQNKNPLSRDEEGKAMMRDWYNRAALGDVAPLQEWVDNNCTQRQQDLISPDSGTPSTSGDHGLMGASMLENQAAEFRTYDSHDDMRVLDRSNATHYAKEWMYNWSLRATGT